MWSDDANSVLCNVSKGTWDYYQAYVDVNVIPGEVGGDFGTAKLRFQILARRGGTGVHIGGLWMVYRDGPRKWARVRMSAVDGSCHTRAAGAWNYNGNFNNDGALRGVTEDPSRWPTISPTNLVGLAYGDHRCWPRLQFQLEVYNDGGEAPLRSGGENLFVTFQQY